MIPKPFKISNIAALLVWQSCFFSLAAEEVFESWSQAQLVRISFEKDIETRYQQDSATGEGSLDEKKATMARSIIISYPQDKISGWNDVIKNLKSRSSSELWELAESNEGARKELERLVSVSSKAPCQIKKLTIEPYIKHQKKVLKNAQGTYEPELIQYVKLWKKPRLYCLLSTMAERFKTEDRYDYKVLALTLKQLHPNYQDDLFLTALIAQRYLRDNEFAEALRSTFILQKTSTAMKSIYKLVQKQYSLKQKGKGEVAIKSL